MVNELSNQDLVRYYTEQLKKTGIQSVTQLRENIGTVNLTFDDTKIIPEERQREIERDNPDKIFIAGREVEVTYRYDSYYDKQTAKIVLEPDFVFKVNELPTIPSGTEITIIIKDNGSERFSGSNLEELKGKSETYLLEKTWSEYSSKHSEVEQRELNEFNPLTDPTPQIPQPVVYGNNPRTNEEAVAYAALTYKRPYWSSDTAYSVKYYPSRQLAEFANLKSEVKIELTKKQTEIDDVKNNYERYGLSYDEKYKFSREVDEVESLLEENPSLAKEKLDLLQQRIGEVRESGSKKEGTKNRVDELLREKYSKCPLCGSELNDGECTRSHNEEQIKFVLSEDGREELETELSRIKVRLTDNTEKDVAILMVAGDSTRRRQKGEVYLLTKYNLPNGYWDGESGEAVFEDNNKILNEDQISERRQEKAKQPLPEGVTLLGTSIDSGSVSVYAVQREDGSWGLCGLSPDGKSTTYFKGFRSQSVGSSVEELARSYYKGQSQLREVLDRLQSKSSETSDFAIALKEAREKKDSLTGPPQAMEVVSEGPMSADKRKRVEKELEETRKKLSTVKFELDIQLQQEKKKAINVASGETNVDISKRNTKIVANFDKEYEPGSYYAEVVDWSTNMIRRFVISGQQGEQYVEVVENMPGGEFHSESLNIDGTSHRVKQVDLTENNNQVKILEEKIGKLSRRLETKPQE